MPTPTYDLIASNVLTSSAASVTFSSIPATYRDLVLVADALSTSSTALEIEFNSDSGNNYYIVQMHGDGSSAASGTETWSAFYPYAGVTNTNRMLAVVQIMDYSATDKHKSILARSNRADQRVAANAGRWANTNAITSIKLTASGHSLASGTTFYLYGIVS